MHERPQLIAYEFHKARAKRLRAAAIDDLFRRLAALVRVRRRRPKLEQGAPALRLVSR